MSEVPEISPAELPLNHPFLILDVREDFEWQFVHLPGSLHLPLGELGRRFRELPKDRPLLCLCHHGMRSRQAAEFLSAKGFQTANLSGGIDRWAIENDPGMPRY